MLTNAPPRRSRQRTVLASLLCKPWQTRLQLGLPVTDGNTLLRLERKGLLQRRPSTHAFGCYEYALPGADRNAASQP